MANNDQIRDEKLQYDINREAAFEKQIKKIEDQGQKQVEALKNLKPKEQKQLQINLMTNL